MLVGVRKSSSQKYDTGTGQIHMAYEEDDNGTLRFTGLAEAVIYILRVINILLC